MKSKMIFKKLDTYLKQIIQRGFPENGFHFPVNPDSIEDNELEAVCRRVSTLFEMMNEACQFSEQLARGNLQASAPRNNFFTMPLKSLQASLAHLTWQVHQVAEGDLKQQVYFLGEFSESFNHMIESLKEKQVLEQRLKVITEVLGEGLLYVDNEGKILFANPEALRIFEYDSGEIIGKTAADMIFHPSSRGTGLGDSILKGEKFDVEDRLINGKAGKATAVSISARPVYKKDILDGSVITIRDISEQKKYLLLLEKQAMTDALTGIFNRMKFDEILSTEIQRSKRNKVPLALIICDIDHFKQVNDQYGHPAGDKILKTLVKLISANIRSIDFFARWGGEEFVILSPGTDSRGAANLAEKIRRKVELHNFRNPGHITLSFGVTCFKSGDNATKLITRADEAMYKAKAKGRNRVQLSN